jgi:hypothetical protein
MTESNKMKRRGILKASGAAIGITGIGSISRSVEASATSDAIGQTNFVQVTIQHKKVPRLPTNNTDDFAKYRLNLSESELRLTNWAPANALEIATNNDFTLVNGRGEFRSIRHAKYGGEKSETTPINPTKDLVLAEPYRTPTVHVEKSSNKAVTVRVNGNTATVEPGSSTDIELRLRKAKGRQKVVGTKEILDPRSKAKTIEVPKRGKVKTVSLRPIITLENYGTMEVFAPQ